MIGRHTDDKTGGRPGSAKFSTLGELAGIMPDEWRSAYTRKAEVASARKHFGYAAYPRAATFALSTKTRDPRAVSSGRIRSAVNVNRSMCSSTQLARSLSAIGRPAASSIASPDTTTVKPMPFLAIGNSTAPPIESICIPSVIILKQSEAAKSDLQANEPLRNCVIRKDGGSAAYLIEQIKDAYRHFADGCEVRCPVELAGAAGEWPAYVLRCRLGRCDGPAERAAPPP